MATLPQSPFESCQVGIVPLPSNANVGVLTFSVSYAEADGRPTTFCRSGLPGIVPCSRSQL